MDPEGHFLSPLESTPWSQRDLADPPAITTPGRNLENPPPPISSPIQQYPPANSVEGRIVTKNPPIREVIMGSETAQYKRSADCLSETSDALKKTRLEFLSLMPPLIIVPLVALPGSPANYANDDGSISNMTVD